MEPVGILEASEVPRGLAESYIIKRSRFFKTPLDNIKELGGDRTLYDKHPDDSYHKKDIAGDSHAKVEGAFREGFRITPMLVDPDGLITNRQSLKDMTSFNSQLEYLNKNYTETANQQKRISLKKEIDAVEEKKQTLLDLAAAERNKNVTDAYVIQFKKDGLAKSRELVTQRENDGPVMREIRKTALKQAFPQQALKRPFSELDK